MRKVWCGTYRPLESVKKNATGQFENKIACENFKKSLSSRADKAVLLPD